MNIQNVNSTFGSSRAVAKTFRFIAEKRPIVKSKTAIPDESFFENLGRRIDERLAKTSEAQTIRNRAVLQTDADWRDRYRVMV